MRRDRIWNFTVMGFVSGLLFPLAALCSDTAIVTVNSGSLDRHASPVVCALPSNLQDAPALELTSIETGRKVPVQRSSGDVASAVWILEAPLAAGQTRRYQLAAAAAKPADKSAVRVLDDGRSLSFTVGGKRALSYNYDVIEPPPGIEKHFRRSGFIHPIYTPSGKVLTDDFPADHAHQHGVFFAWVNSTFEDREVDFWNEAKGKGRISHLRFEHVVSGPVFGEFRAALLHSDLTSPDGERPVLVETWTVRAFRLADYFLIDLESQQRCFSPELISSEGESSSLARIEAKPLLINEYHYGGFALRGSGDWFPEGGQFLTSEGLTGENGNHSRPTWVETFGPVEGADCGIVIMSHPNNFRHPQPVRLHPSKPYFCFAPMVLGEFAIVPDKPYLSKYRVIAHDGKPNPSFNDDRMSDYAEPLAAAVEK